MALNFFKLKYNVLAFLQVMIGLVNYFILVNIFGISAHTDAYLLVSAIIGSLLLLQMLPIEQFMFFYNDIKSKNVKDAHEFYSVAFTVAALTALITFIICYYGSSYIIDLFISGSDNSRRILIYTFFNIAIFELLFASMQSVNQKVMNAEMYFAAPYILNLISSIFVLATMIYMYYLKLEDISLLIYARVFGSLVSLVVSFLMVKKIHIPVKFCLTHTELKPFLRNSFTMRFGHNIHNFLFIPITTNILTALPSGMASYFYYALKFSTIVNSVVVGPSNNMFQSKFSKSWSQGHIEKAKGYIFQYLKVTVLLIIASGVVGYFVLPSMLHFITEKITPVGLSTIQGLFAGLLLWQFVVLVESGSVIILVVEKRSEIFIYTNCLFALMYFGLAHFLLGDFSVYSLIYSLVLAQVVNFLLYRYFSGKILQQREKVNEP